MVTYQVKGMIETTTKRTTLRHRILLETIRPQLLFLLCLGLIILVMTGVFCRATVVGHSMDPTLGDGKHYLLLRTQWNPWISVRAGDIVVAKYENGTIVKRVIAGPGDTLEIRGGTVYRNGRILQEQYINEPMKTQDVAPVTLGDDQYYLMGDNRNRSADSRSFGTFSHQSIMGVLYLEEQPFLWAVYGLLIISISTMACSLVYTREEDDAHAK